MPIISCDSVIFIIWKHEVVSQKPDFISSLTLCQHWGGGAWGQQLWRTARASAAHFSCLSLLLHPLVIPLPSNRHKLPVCHQFQVRPLVVFLLLLSPFLPLHLSFVTHSCSTPASYSCVRRCEWPCYSEFYKYFSCSTEIWFFPENRLTQESLERGRGTMQASFLQLNLPF